MTRSPMTGPRTDTRPDIVIAHAHDLGTWLSFLGMPSVPSPQLARFAAGSVVFENAFATAPLCTPARSSLMTGTSPHVNGLQGLAHHGWRYRTGVRTLPELLAPAGYHTVLVGLQHEHSNAAVLGYDEVAGAGFLPRALPVVAEAEGYLRRRAQQRAAEGQAAPLLMVVGTWEVHRPWPVEDYAPADPHGVDVPAYLPDTPDTRADIAAFHGAIRQLDLAMGRLFTAIDAFTDPGNTMVVFTTDHGAAFPRAKGTLYDAGVRVALVVRPPRSWGVGPGRRSALVSHLDVVPTVLEAAGAELPSWLEGNSLVPLLSGDVPEERDDRTLVLQKAYHDTYDPLRAVRTRRHKLIRTFQPGTPQPLGKDVADSRTRAGMSDADFPPRPPVELYDLRADPDEQVSLADSPQHADVRAALEARLAAWMDAMADPLATGPVPPPPPQSRETDALPALEGTPDPRAGREALGQPHSAATGDAAGRAGTGGPAR
jgi:arylsulfatase A-like enzyme